MSELFRGVAEGNFGASNTCDPGEPGIAPDGYGEPKTIVKFPGNLGRHHNDVQAHDPGIITASVYGYPFLQPTAGPVTGIAIWGSGGGDTNTAEFDIPILTNPTFALDDTRFLPFGGTLISVVGTSLEIRARNDAMLIPPPTDVNGLPSGPIGGGGDAITTPAVITAGLAKGTKSTFARAVKTVWGYFDDLSDLGPPRGLPQNDSVTMLIPPFATSVRIARSAAIAGVAAPAILVSVGERNLTAFVEGPYSFGAGVPASEIILSKQANLVTVLNNSANRIAAVLAIFTLSI